MENKMIDVDEVLEYLLHLLSLQDNCTYKMEKELKEVKK